MKQEWPKYNVIRWPDAQGAWWLVSEASETSGYAPIRELHPKWQKNGVLLPTWENQLFTAAELLVNDGIDAVRNPHSATGAMCKCRNCFCCAALQIVKDVRARELRSRDSSRPIQRR